MDRDRKPTVRTVPHTIEALDIYAAGMECHSIPVAFLSIMRSALAELESAYVWTGDDAQVALTLRQVQDFLALFGTQYTKCDMPQPGDDGNNDNYNLIQYLMSASDSRSEETMSLCGYNPKAFKIEDGALWIKDFCGDWVQIGSFGGGGDDPIVTLPPDIDPVETGLYVCGMAYHVADTLVELADYVFSNAGGWATPGMPWLCENHMNLDLNNQQIILAVGQASIMKGVIILADVALDISQDDAIPDGLTNEIACALLPMMQADGSVDADGLYSSIKNFFSSKWPLLASVNNVFIRNFWDEIIAAIGKGNFADIATAGALDADAVCDCTPDPFEIVPTDGGWYLGQPFTKKVIDAGEYNTKMCIPMAEQHDAFGIVFILDWSSSSTNSIRQQSSSESGCPSAAFTGWGNTSDHLEYNPHGTTYGCGNSTVINELLGAGNWTSKPSNYNTVSDPATPPVLGGVVRTHGFFMDNAAVGDWFQITIRTIHNVNSPSHA